VACALSRLRAEFASPVLPVLAEVMRFGRLARRENASDRCLYRPRPPSRNSPPGSSPTKVRAGLASSSCTMFDDEQWGGGGGGSVLEYLGRENAARGARAKLGDLYYVGVRRSGGRTCVYDVADSAGAATGRGRRCPRGPSPTG